MLIHLGLHRTGTTFLQKEILPKLGVDYLSNEDFSGNAISSRYCNDERYALFNYLVGKDDKVLVVFRDKKSWVNSLYKKYVMNGGSYCFADWYERIFDMACLDFERYKEYIIASGVRFLFLDFEQLVVDADGFVKDICDFVGVGSIDFNNKKHNKADSSVMINVKRYVNMIRSVL